MSIRARAILVLGVPEPEMKAAEELVRTKMTGVATMKVPLEVEESFGQTWAAAKS